MIAKDELTEAFYRGITKGNAEAMKLLIDLLWSVDPALLMAIDPLSHLIHSLNSSEVDALTPIKDHAGSHLPDSEEKARMQDVAMLKMRQFGSSKVVVESALNQYGKLIAPEILIQAIENIQDD